MNNLKVWKVSYYWTGSWGAYQTYEYVCVAETAKQAIQMAMEDCGDKPDPQNWYAEEIPTTAPVAMQINQQCS
jgi:hypothetical protein